MKRKTLNVFTFIFPLISCCAGYCASSDDAGRGKNQAILVVIRDAGSWDIDIYVDDRKIINVRAHTINHIEVPLGIHSVIMDIKSGSSGYYINNFSFQKDDTLPICIKHVPSPITAIVEAKMEPVSLDNLRDKQSSGYFEQTHSSWFSAQQRLPGAIYSRLMREQAVGNRFVKKVNFDSYGVSVNGGLSFGSGPKSALAISKGKNIEAEIYCMLTPHWGAGFGIGYSGDDFEMSEHSISSQRTLSIELRQWDYFWFLKIALVRQSGSSLFVEPGFGYISGSSTTQTNSQYSSYGYYRGSGKTAIQQPCLIVHAGLCFGMVELRFGYFSGVESSSPAWYTATIGVNFATGSKDQSQQ